MDHVVFGLFAIIAGSVFCFRGYRTMRVILPIWGAFIGFAFGTALVAIIDDSGILATTAGWVVGIIMAIVFGVLSYAYYSVAVALSFAGIGFSITASILGLAGVENAWIFLFIGGAVGVACAVMALQANLPFYALVVMSAWGGAGAMVTGAVALFDRSTIGASPYVLATGRDGLFGALVALVLTIAGVVVQVNDKRRVDLLHDQW